MRYTAIADASEYLVRLMRSFCVPDPIQGADKIGLETHNDMDNLSLSIRLFDIQTMNANQFKPLCVPLCLKYRLTAHSQSIPEMRALEEHKILGKVICVLAEHPFIHTGTEFLGQQDTAVSILFENISSEKLSERRKNGTSVFYSVSPILLDIAEKTPAVRVRSTQ